MPDNRKVIIRGYVFAYEEKAPFVASGVSVYGAVEWDEARDRLRCHECGEWYENLGAHILNGHKMDPREYRSNHGLRINSALVSFGMRKKFAADMAARPGMKAYKAGHSPRVAGRRRYVSAPGRGETRNLSGRCRAQVLFKIQTLAQKLGRTPTVEELRANKVHPKVLYAQFGVGVGEVMRMAGLEPRPVGSKLDERMPWPADYFGVKVEKARAI